MPAVPCRPLGFKRNRGNLIQRQGARAFILSLISRLLRAKPVSLNCHLFRSKAHMMCHRPKPDPDPHSTMPPPVQRPRPGIRLGHQP